MSLNEDSYREHVEQEMDELWSPVKGWCTSFSVLIPTPQNAACSHQKDGCYPS